MTVEVPGAMNGCRPCAHGVVVQDDAFATLFDFGVVGGCLVPGEVAKGFPDLSMVEIMIAEDQPFTAVEPVKNLFRSGDIVTAEIAEMPNDIVRSNDRIPGVNDELIHFIR